ncbi:SRPBCC domain-containing protein [Arthrobacter sp. zg-Y1171]|uniref:SRPBCC domain-containing protein n=1 Tax=Arthrobacter sp. zg-Y1171 TaxID=2964610 RepID=UPI002102CFB4|nr:SRPBCC domain-containing protein [Arthrobacter sp. zg-Y1171]MCQ1995789.1 SRPBCC domain-containing protein [Arthrobacter sp. zg-Y1171]UWX83130.1 SRPBCC domain-containing protein [Arthrobacter sp. zg-Y1171]
MPLTSVSTADGSLRISWTFPAPAPAVWAGFADAALLSQWLGRPVECDVRADGSIVVDHSGGYLSRSVITDVEEPRHLAMSWEFPEEHESRIQIRLQDAEEGTLMDFTHHDLGALVDSYGPGWITDLTYLEAAIAGGAIPASRFWPLHATFETLYAARVAADAVTG